MQNAWTRRQFAASLAGLGAATLAPFARAASYPTHSVRTLVGSPPGGPVDFMARIYGDSVGQLLGQAFVVENRPGASGTLAADMAVRAPADGYTLMAAGPASITAAPHLFPKLNYDPAKDFVPVSMLGAGAFAFVINPSVPARNVQELIAYAKAKPGSLTYGSGGTGSSGQLCAEAFSAATGIKMMHVPYKGDGPAVTDLISGQIQVFFTAPNVAMPYVESGRLRLLGFTTRDRVASMPKVPTIAEQGVKDFEFLGWVAMFAPAGTPKADIDTLVAAWNKARVTPAVHKKLEDLAMVAPERLISGPPLAAYLKGESEHLAKIIRDNNIHIE